MRLCTFNPIGQGPREGRLGIVKGSKVFEVEGQETMAGFLASGVSGNRVTDAGEGFSLDKVVLHAPVPRPGKIIAAIVNTRGMLGGDDITLQRPRLDMKAPSTVVGLGTPIRAPTSGIRPEVELAAVVGKRLSKASPEEAGEGLLGYTILNDVTSPSDSRDDAYEAYRRDRATGQLRKTTLRGPLFRSKNHDSFCPMGPWVVTGDEIDIGRNLRMSTRFDGVLVQDGSTAEYIFSPWRLASYVSGFLALEPGDVVSCGSVGWTMEALGGLDPTEYLLPSTGGTLELEIEGLGKLVNPVVPEETPSGHRV